MKWKTTYGAVEVEEQRFRLGDKKGKRFSPFSFSSGIKHGYYSKPLRRRVCDFGADHSFVVASKKMKEHYGVDVAPDMVRKVTEYHAEEIALKEEYGFFDQEKKANPVVVGEIDGCMVPVVEIDNEKLSRKKDNRKYRRLKYREARLSVAFRPGSRDRKFAGTFASTEIAGKRLKSCVTKIGLDKKTKIHCVGDGAVWIADQVEEQFGSSGYYLIDFYHLCEYLSAAAKSICPLKDRITWMEKQKTNLKQNRYKDVLLALKPYLEKEMGDKTQDIPVTDCYRYIENRQDHFDYKGAIENGLPIGSGEIESAHRYVIQKRLKIAGAWWKEENAEKMLALRICRANNNWEQYWNKAAA